MEMAEGLLEVGVVVFMGSGFGLGKAVGFGCRLRRVGSMDDALGSGPVAKVRRWVVR